MAKDGKKESKCGVSPPYIFFVLDERRNFVQNAESEWRGEKWVDATANQPKNWLLKIILVEEISREGNEPFYMTMGTGSGELELWARTRFSPWTFRCKVPAFQ